MFTMSTEKRESSLGTHIAHLVQALALKKQWTKAYATQYIADAAGFGADIVYKWRQNRLTPSDDTILILLQIGCTEAKLPRTWGQELVSAARYPEAATTVDELWLPEPLCEIPHNLPKPTYSLFIGRQPQQRRLLALLGPESAAPLIMIDGIGGVGKTALIVKTAYQCLAASTDPSVRNPATESAFPTFAMIIFVSAKQKYLTADGILPRAYAPNTLRAIYREIAYMLELDLTHIALDELPGQIRHALGRQRTLLIVDNLETVEDKDRVLAFLYELPASVKVVVTTREQRYYTPIQLDCLTHEEGSALIRHELARQQLQLSKNEIEALYQGTGGIPAAIIYGVGQLTAGCALANVLKRLADHEGDIARFFFQDSVAPLRGRPAHHLLMAIALFTRQPVTHFAFRVAGLDERQSSSNDAEVQLLRLSLIHRQDTHFIIHPLTREYTLAELSSQVEFELAARKRWVEIYRAFAAEVGGVDWGDWVEQYAPLEAEWENIYAVVDWCLHRHRYEDLIHFWQHLSGFLLNYGHTDDHLLLLQWVCQESERRGDWSNHVEALYQKARMLMAMGMADQIQEANQLLQQAWSLRSHVDPALQSYVADALAEWHLDRQRMIDAHYWLEAAALLLPQIEIEPRLRVRKQINTLFQRAVYHVKSDQLTEAQQLFGEVQQLCQQIGWMRIYYDAQKWLADLKMLPCNLRETDQLLQEGLHAGERNCDHQYSAADKRALANLVHQQGGGRAAQQWCGETAATVEQIGTRKDTQTRCAETLQTTPV